MTNWMCCPIVIGTPTYMNTPQQSPTPLLTTTPLTQHACVLLKEQSFVHDLSSNQDGMLDSNGRLLRVMGVNVGVDWCDGRWRMLITLHNAPFLCSPHRSSQIRRTKFSLWSRYRSFSALAISCQQKEDVPSERHLTYHHRRKFYELLFAYEYHYDSNS